ncbi:gluconokinase [Mycobacteroides chelonae]|nr:gluconokinase [Mycobacteroides chelonae]
MVEAPPPLVVVVMGVAGVGKTTVARLLAQRLGAPYAEADDFHPEANIAKMSAGIPLDDADRWPWLRQIAEWMSERGREGTGGVITCSALKRSYRDVLRAGCPDAFFLHLSGDRTLVGDRMSHRAGHFMPTSLLESQFEILEPLGSDENGVVLDVGSGPDELVAEALKQLGA